MTPAFTAAARDRSAPWDFRGSVHGELYCLTDRALSGLGHLDQARRMLAAGVRVIQLRDKTATDQELSGDARAIAALCRESGAWFIINDRLRLARDCGAHGVHIGQGDGSIEAARSILGPGALIGRSTHNEEQLRAAFRERPDYVAVGPVFGTRTKANPDPETGTGLVERALELAGGLPVVAIGGIDLTNIDRVPARALVAVISGVAAGTDITAAARTLRARALARTRA